MILPRVPASAPPGLADSLAELVESEASRPSARRRGYLVVGELFPTMALGVAISYLSVDNEAQEESVGNDSVGISAEWFFRRNVAVYVTARRTRIDDPIGAYHRQVRQCLRAVAGPALKRVTDNTCRCSAGHCAWANRLVRASIPCLAGQALAAANAG